MTMMPRIRTVKPELFMHEGLFEIAKNYQLPLQFAFIGLFTCSDREGRFCWQPRRLKASILPYHEVDMEAVLEIFVAHGFIKKYAHQGQWYGCIPSWSKHQVIRHEAESILPPPDDPDWAKPEPKNLHFSSLEMETEDRLALPFLDESPAEFENKNPIKNNDLPPEKISASRARARRSRARGREGNGMEEKGKEVNGKEGEEDNIVASEMRPPLEDPVRFIFEYWQTVMEHPAAKLDKQRKSMIERALKWQYTTEELCQAITGCSLTPHNRGENDRGERYDGLHIIFRNCDQIDRFRQNYHKPPRPFSEANRRTYANVHTLYEWGQAKIAEGRQNARR
jgi:hypothetical protein